MAQASDTKHLLVERRKRYFSDSLKALADQEVAPQHTVKEAIREFGINPEKRTRRGLDRTGVSLI
jgi:transposase-like protein